MATIKAQMGLISWKSYGDMSFLDLIHMARQLQGGAANVYHFRVQSAVRRCSATIKKELINQRHFIRRTAQRNAPWKVFAEVTGEGLFFDARCFFFRQFFFFLFFLGLLLIFVRKKNGLDCDGCGNVYVDPR